MPFIFFLFLEFTNVFKDGENIQFSRNRLLQGRLTRFFVRHELKKGLSIHILFPLKDKWSIFVIQWNLCSLQQNTVEEERIWRPNDVTLQPLMRISLHSHATVSIDDFVVWQCEWIHPFQFVSIKRGLRVRYTYSINVLFGLLLATRKTIKIFL